MTKDEFLGRRREALLEQIEAETALMRARQDTELVYRDKLLAEIEAIKAHTQMKGSTQ